VDESTPERNWGIMTWIEMDRAQARTRQRKQRKQQKQQKQQKQRKQQKQQSKATKKRKRKGRQIDREDQQWLGKKRDYSHLHLPPGGIRDVPLVA
jgi:hypothetical protein